MKPYSLIAIVFLILVSLIIIPVSAVTLTGTLGGSAYNSTNFGITPSYGGPASGFTELQVFGSDYTNGLKTLVRFDYYSATYKWIPSYPSTLASNSTTISLWTGAGGTGKLMGRGTMGFQRFWSGSPAVETYGYQYITFSYWNISNGTPNMNGETIYINFDGAPNFELKTASLPQGPSPISNPWPSQVIFYKAGQANSPGGYTRNIEVTTYADYSVTKPSGLGITGTITKTSGGTTYPSRGFVYNATSGAGIGSESQPTVLTYNINTMADTIILGINDGTSQYNSSPLFSPTPPTPTPTGSPTPEPGSWSNITYTVRYGVNSTPIPNTFVKLMMYYENGNKGDNDWQQAVDGYTDSNGQITFQQVDISGWDFRAEFTKPGLYQLSFWDDPTAYSYSNPVYMYEQPTGSIIPGVPTKFNVTLKVESATTFQPISGAWVTIGDSISGTSYVGQTTNATGYVYFPQIPNTANINGQITKSGYTPLTYWVTSGSLLGGDASLTKYLYLSSVTVTPTITPVTQEGVTLTASPNSVAPGQTTTLTMTCANATACTGAGGMHIVTYSEKYPDPSWDTHVIAIYHYNTSNSKYDYRPNADAPWQVGTWNGLTATGIPTLSGVNTYYVNAVRDDYFSIGSANVGVLVTGAVAGNLNMKLASQDQTTGGHLSNYQMNLTNRNTLVVTEFGTVAYEVNKLLPRGQDYTVQCSKDGYLPGTANFIVPTDPNVEDGDMGTFVNCPLYPTGSVSAGNTTVTVKVFDMENYMPLPGVTVQMSAPVIYSDSPKYTGGDGAGVFFILGQNQPYSVTVSKTGYCAVTETGNTSTLDTKNVYLNLKYGSCLGPTPTHTPTPGPTGTGTVIVTPTPFQPGNATSFWGPWINVFHYMGAADGEINMLLAGLIILLLMACGAGMAGVLGAEVAMGFGAIFCVAIGLIPIWVVLAIIILGFLFYGLKIGR